MNSTLVNAGDLYRTTCHTVNLWDWHLMFDEETYSRVGFIQKCGTGLLVLSNLNDKYKFHYVLVLTSDGRVGCVGTGVIEPVWEHARNDA